MDRMWVYIFVTCSMIQGVVFAQSSGYIGCYRNSNDLEPKKYKVMDNNSGHECKDFCFPDKRYAGTSINRCICYDNIFLGTKVDEGSCTSNCPNATEMCGGVNSVSMYDLNATEALSIEAVTTSTTSRPTTKPSTTEPLVTTESRTHSTLSQTMKTSSELIGVVDRGSIHESTSTLESTNGIDVLPSTKPSTTEPLVTTKSETYSTLSQSIETSSEPIGIADTASSIHESTSTSESTNGIDVLSNTNTSDANPILHYVIPSIVAVVLLITAALLFRYNRNKRREKQIIVREDHPNEDEISGRGTSCEAEYAVIEEKPIDPDYDSTTYRPKQQPTTVTGNVYGQLNMLTVNSAREQNTESEYDTTTWRPKQPTLCTENDYGQLNMLGVNVVTGHNDKEAESDYDTTIRRPNSTPRGIENEYGQLNIPVPQNIGACVDVEGDYSHIEEVRHKLKSTDGVEIPELTKELKVADATLLPGTSSKDSTYDTLKYNVSSV